MLGLLLAAAMAVTPTDQTVNVAKGVKLDVNNFAGDVIVKVWDKDAVRVEVNHSDREVVDIKQGEQTLSIRSRSTRGGPPRSLDYTITVPKWMGISVAGTYADVTLDGVGGDVSVDTTRGDIKVSGGSGFISLKAVQGEISLEKAKGRIEVRSVNEGIHLADVNGDLSAECTNGSILLDRIDSANVDLYTVNGNISYDGPIRDKGLYRLTTHNGTIGLGLADKANATLTVRTYNGSFRSTFPLKLDDQSPHKRFTVALGNGSAHVELESFGGSILLRRPGEPRPEVEREAERKKARERAREKDKDKEKEKDLAMGGAMPEMERALAAVQPEIERTMRDVQPEIERAMREAQPQIDQAIRDAMDAARAMIPFVMPMPHPDPHPRQ
jgi:DUF4097 and DUF4098 domain-containing protein YvlB